MNFGPLEFDAWLERRQARDAGREKGRAAATTPGPASNQLAVIAGPRELTPRVRAARIEAVSVYEAIVDRAPDRGDPVRVRVQPGWRPVVLVLSSPHPVHWQIAAEAGTDLRAVLLAGSGESRVSAAPRVLVSALGGCHGFKRGTPEFRQLEREVLRCTGCALEHFYGMYAEESFDVGLE
jgi:hypothetical protein